MADPEPRTPDAWFSPHLRRSIVDKIGGTYYSYGVILDKTPAQLEETVFKTAIGKEQYLYFIARLIIHLKKIGTTPPPPLPVPAEPVPQNLIPVATAVTASVQDSRVAGSSSPSPSSSSPSSSSLTSSTAQSEQSTQPQASTSTGSTSAEAGPSQVNTLSSTSEVPAVPSLVTHVNGRYEVVGSSLLPRTPRQWHSPQLRRGVLMKVVNTYNNYPVATEKTPVEVEEAMFLGVRNKEHYMTFAARLIIQLRNGPKSIFAYRTRVKPSPPATAAAASTSETSSDVVSQSGQQ